MKTLAERTPVPITALQVNLPHDPDALYIYRGCAIVGRPDGFDVLDPTCPDPDSEYAEFGWGGTMFDAMAIANENVEGCERSHKR